MGRRKKEPKSVHRENISAAAANLFTEKGIAAATMDDIAKAAGYSKATLYVYFENKEEIVGLIVLNSMKKLCAYISEALSQEKAAKARYGLICRALVRYQEEFPFYFDLLLDKININFDAPDCLPEEKETYQVGEEIRRVLTDFIAQGIERGELRGDIKAYPTVFAFWGMLSGLVQLASSKAEYIESAMGLSKEQFLNHGFELIYKSIENKVKE